MTSAPRDPKTQPMTVPRFRAAKAKGSKLSVLTGYDWMWAGILDAAGVDAILVGDSLAMVVQGHPTTLPVTLDEIIYHAKMVVRGTRPRPGGRRHALSLVPGEPLAGDRERGADHQRDRGGRRQIGRGRGTGRNDPRPHRGRHPRHGTRRHETAVDPFARGNGQDPAR